MFDSNKQEIKLDKVLLKEKVMTGILSQPLSNGTYEVQWTIVGEDGHPIQGKYSFSVKREGDKQAQTELKTTPSPSPLKVLRIGSDEAIELFQSSNSVFDENDIANMKILNYVDSYINEFFFANNIIIVEGDTE